MALVTICIPTYNGATFLAECLESALAQSFADLEILVVDDCSTDDTLAIAQSYAHRDQRLRVHRNTRNLGLVANWNRTVTLAGGEWVKFLHQDDRLEVECVDRMLSAALPHVDLVATRRELTFTPDTSDDVKSWYRSYVAENSISRLFPSTVYVSPKRFAETVLLEGLRNFLGEPTAILLRRSAFGRYGSFHSELVSLCDWEYWVRVAVNTGLCYVDQPLACFRVHSASESARLRATKRFRLRLDPLVMLCEMTYSPHYLPLRQAAGDMNPPVNLRRRLSDEVLDTHWEARAAEDPGEAIAQWWQTVRRHPRLLAFSPRYTLQFLRSGLAR